MLQSMHYTLYSIYAFLITCTTHNYWILHMYAKYYALHTSFLHLHTKYYALHTAHYALHNVSHICILNRCSNMHSTFFVLKVAKRWKVSSKFWKHSENFGKFPGFFGIFQEFLESFRKFTGYFPPLCNSTCTTYCKLCIIHLVLQIHSRI